MIVLDSNVLLYALGRDHPLRQPCRRLVEAIGNHLIDATTTVEVIQEFVHVRARRYGRGDASQQGSNYVSLLSPLISLEDRDLRAGLRLFERAVELDAFGAVLAATAVARDARALVSADAGFASVPRLRHIDPGSPALDELLGA